MPVEEEEEEEKEEGGWGRGRGEGERGGRRILGGGKSFVGNGPKPRFVTRYE